MDALKQVDRWCDAMSDDLEKHTFTVTVKEVFKFDVYANSKEEALRDVKRAYNLDELPLSVNHLEYTEFE